jgi:hypothetical protein
MTDATTDSMRESDNGLHHCIAMAAYELYERRGRIDGLDLEDWFKAEAIVNGRTEWAIRMTRPRQLLIPKAENPRQKRAEHFSPG